jgi:response regulator NasT
MPARTIARAAPAPPVSRLRVLVLGCGEAEDRDLAALGHEAVGDESADRPPDVALVGAGGGHGPALQAIDRFVSQSLCPVVAVLRGDGSAFAGQAAAHGAFACVVGTGPGELQSAIEVAVRRFADYRGLEQAFARRAVVERAKGILMERHSVDDAAAFEMLRAQARSTNRKLVSVAGAVVEGHRLLPGG